MKLVFATHNKNKLKEVQSMLPADIELLTLDEIGCFEDIPETSPTIEENALQKALYVKEKYGYDVFADDTGLEARLWTMLLGYIQHGMLGKRKIMKLIYPYCSRIWKVKGKDRHASRLFLPFV